MLTDHLSAWREIIRSYYTRYSSIEVGGFRVLAPYWINKINDDAHPCPGGPYGGKALPEEIEYAARVHANRHGASVESATAARQLLEGMRLGIDCSGYVYHIVCALIRYEVRDNYPTRPGIYPEDVLRGIDGTGRLRRLNANILTSEHNGCCISPREVRTGDLVRWSGGKHVGIVVDSDDDGCTITHSTSRTSPTGPQWDFVSFEAIDRKEIDLDPNGFWRLRTLDQYAIEGDAR